MKRSLTLTAIETFDLPNDDYEFQNAVNATSWRAVVSELDAWLREQIKYGDPTAVDATMVREKLFELAKDEGVEI